MNFDPRLNCVINSSVYSKPESNKNGAISSQPTHKNQNDKYTFQCL